MAAQPTWLPIPATTGLAAPLLPGADLRRTITLGVIVLMVLGIIAILEAPLRRGS